MSNHYVFDDSFYKSQVDESGISASHIVPLLRELINPASVLDVGCGVGTWLDAWSRLGVEDFIGLDGNYVNRTQLRIPTNKFLPTDLTTPFTLTRQFDLVMSLEVAEHLPRSAADSFVSSICAHGPVVVFSAAIPGQPGLNHVNCQWQDYWIEKFSDQGFEYHDSLRASIWEIAEVAPYYRQNILMFTDRSALSQIPVHGSRPLGRVVHPDVYEERALASIRRFVEIRLRSKNYRSRTRATLRPAFQRLSDLVASDRRP